MKKNKLLNFAIVLMIFFSNLFASNQPPQADEHIRQNQVLPANSGFIAIDVRVPQPPGRRRFLPNQSSPERESLWAYFLQSADQHAGCIAGCCYFSCLAVAIIVAGNVFGLFKKNTE